MSNQNCAPRRKAKVSLRRRLWRGGSGFLAAALLSLHCAPATWSYRPSDTGSEARVTAPTRLTVRVHNAPSLALASELAASIRQDLRAAVFPNTVEENPALDASINVMVGTRDWPPCGCSSGILWLLGVPVGKRYWWSAVTVAVADATGARLATYSAASEQGALYGVVLGFPYGCWDGDDRIPAATAAAIDQVKGYITRDSSRFAGAALTVPAQSVEPAAETPQVCPPRPLHTTRAARYLASGFGVLAEFGAVSPELPRPYAMGPDVEAAFEVGFGRLRPVLFARANLGLGADRPVFFPTSRCTAYVGIQEYAVGLGMKSYLDARRRWFVRGDLYPLFVEIKGESWNLLLLGGSTEVHQMNHLGAGMRVSVGVCVRPLVASLFAEVDRWASRARVVRKGWSIGHRWHEETDVDFSTTAFRLGLQAGLWMQ